MTTNYILADMFTRIRNGQQVKLNSVKQPKSVLCMKVLEVLLEEGVIQNFRLDPKNPYWIEILLCYYEDKPVIQ